MKRALCLLMAIMLVFGCMTCLTGCGKKGGKKNDPIDPEQGKVTGGEKGLPEVTITSDKVVICGGPSNVQTYIDLLKEVYELDAEFISVGYNEYTTRFATLVLSGDSPDVGYYRPDQADFPRYIINNLVQDAGQYVDVSDSFYDPVRDLLDATKYQGGYYMMPYVLEQSQTLFYNEKLFRDAGLETPWELYLKDEWTLDKLQEYAIELTEVGADGVPTRYGFCFCRPFGILYTTGKALGSFDPETGAVINNRRDPAFAKAMKYATDWITKYKCTPPNMEETLGWLAIDKAAIVFAQNFYSVQACVQLAQEGNLGIAPMARMADVDGYYARGECLSWWLVEGAKNPGGAIAFWNVTVQDCHTEGKVPSKNQELFDTCRENGYNEKAMEQVMNNYDPTKVKLVLELVPWLGPAWMTIQNSSTWEVELDATEASCQASIDALFQPLTEDLAISPKTINDFEEEGVNDGDPFTGYVVATGGQPVELTYNAANAQGGSKFALQYKYKLEKDQWGGAAVQYNKTWENNDSLRFWIKGDGTKQVIKINVSSINGFTGNYKYTLEGKDGKIVTIPFSDFVMDEENSSAEELEPKKIQNFGIYVETAGSHTFWIDNFEAYNSNN